MAELERVDKLIKKSGVKKNGGKRKGAGRKKGSLGKKTLEKKIVEEALRQRVLRNTQMLLDSQFTIAKGCNYLYYIEKNDKGQKMGKPIRVTDRFTIEAYLADELEDSQNYYFMTTEKPSNQAVDSLLDRTFGKALQSVDNKGELKFIVETRVHGRDKD